MDQPPSDSSPVPIAKRQVVCRFSRLESGFPVASLDPAPIEAREKEIDSIWREAVPFFKMYMNDIIITFDKTHIQFHRSSPSSALNIVRDAILKRLAFDGVKTGNIAMMQNQHHYTMELITPGYQKTSATLQKEIFSLIAVKLPPKVDAPPDKPA